MSQVYHVTGELTDSRTVKLDEPLSAAAGAIPCALTVGDALRAVNRPMRVPGLLHHRFIPQVRRGQR